MNLYETKDVKVFVNMFVHYREAFNGYAISNSFNKYFMEEKLLHLVNDPDFNIMINSAPHYEDQSIKIQIILSQNVYDSLEKEKIILNLKGFVVEYFNNQLKLIDVEFIVK